MPTALHEAPVISPANLPRPEEELFDIKGKIKQLGELELASMGIVAPVGEELPTPEIELETNETLELEMKTDQGEQINGSYSLAGDSNRANQWILVSDADTYKGLLYRGPAYLDEVRGDQGVEFSSLTAPYLPDNGSKPNLFNISVNEQGTITTSRQVVSVENAVGDPTNIDPDQILANELNHSDSSPEVDTKWENISYTQEGPYQISAIRDAYTELGFKDGGIPTPATLVANMDRLRETDTYSGVYYPRLKLFEDGSISPEKFVGAYAKDKAHPVSANSFRYFIHDTAAEHLQETMKDGEPLMDFMSLYGQAALEPETEIYFPELREERPAGIFGGDEKVERAASVLDKINTLMSKIKPTDTKFGEIATGLADSMVEAIRKQGDLEKIPFVADMLKREEIKSADDLKGEDVLREITRLTRDRLKIQMPEANPNVTPEDIL